jgi:hypothetical protein
MKQMNTIVPEGLPDFVRDLRKDYGWSDKGQVVTAGVYALAYLLDRHDKTAAEALEKGAEQDVVDLFVRVSRLMPAPLTNDKVEWGRLSDGRPALIVREEWVIANDNAGDLMAVRRDGSQVGYVAQGDIQVLAERDFDGEIKPLKMPSHAEVALN